MHIVVVGAGSIGRYTAGLLSKENNHVILVDKDPQKLENLEAQMDVSLRAGDATDWVFLENLLDIAPDLFIALTNDDETNLVSCEIAKSLGFPKTIARIRDSRYINSARLDFERIFNVDHFLIPELLVAQEIDKLTETPEALRVESFAHGAVQLRTILIPEKWKKGEKKISEQQLPDSIIIGLIRRKVTDSKGETYKIIFPHGDDYILPGDELTIVGQPEDIARGLQFFGITLTYIKSAVIMGGSLVAINLAKLLEKRNIFVRIIEKDFQKCIFLTEKLPNTTIINHNAADLPFLLEEKVDQADAFISCTRKDEINIMTALLAKEAGCKNIITELSNPYYRPIASRLGLYQTPSPQIITVDHIRTIVLSKAVSSITSLYEGEAEVLEINVSMNSKITGIPIFELGKILPKDFLIAVIENRGRILIANGNRIISPGDTIIVISNPKHVSALEKIL